MENIRYLEKQHQEIVAVVSEISGLIEHDFENKAIRLRGLVVMLIGKLKMHLAMEDNALYPKLFYLDDVKANLIATNFLNEIPVLKKTLDEYLWRWPVPESVSSSPAQFVMETTRLLSVLATRIVKEEQDLYPLLR